MSNQNFALLLSGGGARAAYQAGVLRGIASYSKEQKAMPFDIVCGTSAGAINATILASFASNFHIGTKRLHHIWSHMATEQIYHSSPWALIKHLGCMFGRHFQLEHAISGAPSLLNNAPLKKMIQQYVKFSKIDEQIRRGHLKALSISCSSYQTKQSISFFQSKSCKPWQKTKHLGEKTLLSVEHLLASSAIPIVFPSIEIKRMYLGDGTVHQHAPLSTPIHLGAQKILVISLDSHNKVNSPITSHPSAATLTSHLLETLFSDMLHTDLERFQRINETTSKLDGSAQKELDLRNIDIHVVRPSQDLSTIAQSYFQDIPKAVRILCKALGLSAEKAPNLISYLLFEASYCRKLMQLGYNDALNQKQTILALCKKP